MAVSVVSSSTKASSTSASPLTLNAPASLADGDLILVWCHGDESIAGTAEYDITGFTDVFDPSIKGGATAGASGKLLYKVASSEGASWSVSRTGGSGNWGAIAMRITNAGGTPVIDTYATATSASDESVTPTLTTGANNCLIIRGTSWNQSKTLTAIPASHTAIQHNDLSSNDGHTVYTTAEIATSGTNVGTATYDLSAAAETASFTISIKPPVAGSASSSISPTPSSSISLSISPTPSSSVSLSISPTPSSSISLSPSVSVSLSISPSPSSSVSPSSSISLSPSVSVSLSISLSPSLSISLSPSLSISLSPSLSNSPSPSQGFADYTRGNYAVLPTDDTDLETGYSGQDVTDVASKNDVRVAQVATQQFMLHQYKNFVWANNSCLLEAELQSTLAPTSSTVYLQIYNRNTTTWDTVDSDNSSAQDTDFSLIANVNSLTNYKDGSNVISCRIYQEAL